MRIGIDGGCWLNRRGYGRYTRGVLSALARQDGDDEYFIPIVGLFLSFCLEQMEALIADDTDLQERYELRRAKYLEGEVERLSAELNLPSLGDLEIADQ